MSDLVPLLTPGSTAADKVATLARVAGLKDVIAEREKAVRDDLETDVRSMFEQAGGQGTLSVTEGKAILAGGNAKPRITSPDRFGEWAEGVAAHLAVKVKRVEVVDHDQAVATIDGLAAGSLDVDDDAQTLADTLLSAFKVSEEWLISDSALEDLLSRGRAVVNGELLYDTETAEPIPGVEVSFTRDQFRVVPNKKVRESTAAFLRGRLDALPEGGDA